MPARTLQRSIPTEHSARRVEGEARISRDRRDLVKIPRTTIWDLTPKGDIVQKGSIEYAGLIKRWGGRYSWQVPAEAAGDYRIRVEMEGGPFQLDAANESVIHVSGP